MDLYSVRKATHLCLAPHQLPLRVLRYNIRYPVKSEVLTNGKYIFLQDPMHFLSHDYKERRFVVSLRFTNIIISCSKSFCSLESHDSCDTHLLCWQFYNVNSSAPGAALQGPNQPSAFPHNTLAFRKLFNSNVLQLIF